MIQFEYQILRYIHDRISGEFMNIGIVIYSKDILSIKFIGIPKAGRLSGFFKSDNGNYILSLIKYLEKSINSIEKIKPDMLSFKSPQSLEYISSYFLPKDDSSLEFSDVKTGFDISIDAALNYLYERLIDKYSEEPNEKVQTDKQVWQNVYKAHFDKLGISNKLIEHSVPTKKDVISFDKAWKNGVWNCFQTLAFDFKSEDVIKNKVYKWSGILREIESSAEPLHLYFLTSSPKHHEELEEFIDGTLGDASKGHIQISLIKESEAGDFAISVKEEMEKYMH